MTQKLCSASIISAIALALIGVSGPDARPSGSDCCFDVVRAQIGGPRDRVVLQNQGHRGWGDLRLSPSGRRVAFDVGGEVYVAATDGRNVRAIASKFVNDIAWAPDEKKLALEVWPTAEVWVVNVDGSNLHRVATRALYPQFAPDSNSLAFMGDVSPDFSRGTLTVSDLTGHVRPLVPMPGTRRGVPSLAWSFDNRAIAYVSGTPMRVRIVTVASDRIVDLGRGDSVAWSPTARTLAYVRTVRGQRALREVQANGRFVRNLDVGAAAPVWSTQGEQLAYSRYVSSRCRCRDEIFTITSSGQKRRRVSHLRRGAQIGQIVWTRGQTIYYTRLIPSGV